MKNEKINLDVDRVGIQVFSSIRSVIKECAKNEGITENEYINRCISEKLPLTLDTIMTEEEHRYISERMKKFIKSFKDDKDIFMYRLQLNYRLKDKSTRESEVKKLIDALFENDELGVVEKRKLSKILSYKEGIIEELLNEVFSDKYINIRFEKGLAALK